MIIAVAARSVAIFLGCAEFVRITMFLGIGALTSNASTVRLFRDHFVKILDSMLPVSQIRYDAPKLVED